MVDNIPQVAAVVTAYNEEKHVADVLKVLVAAECLDEVIFVDDGSTDKTPQIAEEFSGVRCLKNSCNKGKGKSMEAGVQATSADIIFFCDADIKGLTADIVSEIVSPVRDGDYDLFIGVRDNVSQKAVKFVALLSGERALRRELWEELDGDYKEHYRVETGLNTLAKTQGYRVGFKKFKYYNTFKESKHGIKGLWERLGMIGDIIVAAFLTVGRGITTFLRTFRH
ncbi:MAG: glycosyltransferase family 2 protein [Chlamydiota bacterium]